MGERLITIGIAVLVVEVLHHKNEDSKIAIRGGGLILAVGLIMCYIFGI